MKVWAHSNNTRINFDSCKQAAKWSKKNNNTKWFYDNGNGPKPGLKSENKRANYLSRITGLVVSSGYDNIKRKDFFLFRK